MPREWDSNEELRDALRANERKGEFSEWWAQRTATVKESVSAHDMLRHFGVTLKQGGSAHEEQFSCPFHGKDKKPSCRVYPDGGRSASHVWCFTCQKNWDVFGLWREFMGHGEDVKFSRIVFEIEKAFGIIAPDAPEPDFKDRGPSEAEIDAEKLLWVCENRLREAKPKYDLEKFARTGQLIDRLWFRFENRTIEAEELLKILRQVIDKIGERMRA